MKRFLILFVMLNVSIAAFAGSPAKEFVSRYEGIKGSRMIQVSGAKMALARPVLKKFPIGPMADSVDEVVVLRVDKASDKVKADFLDDMKNSLIKYVYYGKSETQKGLVDVYVHPKSEELVDELVIYNPEIWVLNILSGDFPVSDLLGLDKQKEN